ncbi:MAG: HEPN domain-containing protein [Phycisphaerae bacterium]
MRPPDDEKKQIVGEWLHKADDDMTLAEYLVSAEKLFTSAITFHCQQASEKYIKALLTWWDVEFPKTHDLQNLLDLVGTVSCELADKLQDIIVLTPYGVEMRYPGDRPDADADEARQAVELASTVRAAVLPLLPASPGPLQTER